jgi:hypothetical protein
MQLSGSGCCSELHNNGWHLTPAVCRCGYAVLPYVFNGGQAGPFYLIIRGAANASVQRLVAVSDMNLAVACCVHMYVLAPQNCLWL